MNHLKVFKLDKGNDLRISCRLQMVWFWRWKEGQRSRLVLGLTLMSAA